MQRDARFRPTLWNAWVFNNWTPFWSGQNLELLCNNEDFRLQAKLACQIVYMGPYGWLIVGPSIWVGPLINDNFRRITLQVMKVDFKVALNAGRPYRFYQPSQLARSLFHWYSETGNVPVPSHFFLWAETGRGLPLPRYVEHLWANPGWINKPEANIELQCFTNLEASWIPWVGGPTAQKSFGMMLPDTVFVGIGSDTYLVGSTRMKEIMRRCGSSFSSSSTWNSIKNSHRKHLRFKVQGSYLRCAERSERNLGGSSKSLPFKCGTFW